MRSGTVEGVEGKYVKNILLDTGCSRNLVHQKLVPEEAFLDGRATTLCLTVVLLANYIQRHCWVLPDLWIIQNMAQPAPLIPLPIIDTPFKRVTMDIVGLLPHSRSGKRYILVLCD